MAQLVKCRQNLYYSLQSETKIEHEHDYLHGSFQRKISGSNGTSGKVVLFFRTEYSKRKFIFYFLKTSSIPFVCIRLDNRFVQMITAIPGRNLPVLNFSYH